MAKAIDGATQTKGETMLMLVCGLDDSVSSILATADRLRKRDNKLCISAAMLVEAMLEEQTSASFTDEELQRLKVASKVAVLRGKISKLTNKAEEC